MKPDHQPEPTSVTVAGTGLCRSRCFRPSRRWAQMKPIGFLRRTRRSPPTTMSGPVEQQDSLGDCLSASRRETLVVLKGDPGTGKSQLINWLKLSFDAAIAQGDRSSIGDRTLRSVLIRRRSGSLKDALQQLVDQLPGYERYLAEIQAAIAGVSGQAANRRLYTEMHHALLASKDGAPRPPEGTRSSLH